MYGSASGYGGTARPSSGSRGLDEADLAIIDALREDGRTPFADIARMLGVSPGMVRQRYQRLVDRGILSVVAVTNPLLMGSAAMVVIGIKVDMARVEHIAAEVAALPEVTWLAVVSGAFDLVAEVHCRDLEDLLSFLAHRLHAIDGVRDTETLTQLKVIKEVYY